MLTSITPLGERGRRSRWGVTTAFFVVGSTFAGALLGGLAGAVGSLLGLGSLGAAPRLLALIGAALIGAWLDLRLRRRALPGVSRQVNEDWLHSYRGWVYGLGFGFQLGLGLVTVVSASAVYLAFLAAALTASPLAGAALGAAFGLLRAATLFAAAGVETPAQLVRLGDRLARWEGPAARLAIAAQTALALAGILLLAAGG
jgi:hypothetical protein